MDLTFDTLGGVLASFNTNYTSKSYLAHSRRLAEDSPRLESQESPGSFHGEEPRSAFEHISELCCAVTALHLAERGTNDCCVVGSRLYANEIAGKRQEEEEEEDRGARGKQKHSSSAVQEAILSAKQATPGCNNKY